MRLSDLAVETFSAFNSNRARSLLTILGIVIGIAAVIAMTALIGGMKTALVGEMGLSQAQLVRAACNYGNGMTVSDADNMARDLDDLFEEFTPLEYGNADVASSKERVGGTIRGVYDSYGAIMGLKFAQGRFFNEQESAGARQVAVLDQPGVKTLFGDRDTQVIGQIVRIGGAEYEIVGVIEDTDSDDGRAKNVDVFLPYSTFSQRISGSRSISMVNALVYENVDPEHAAEEMKQWMIKRFQIPETEQEDSVNTMTMKSIIDQLDTMMATFQMLMTIVASISLVVGGIGIMNMMLTNVTERIREIGLRKALGARRRDITRQFLLESVCITLIGGVLGIVLGFLGAYGLAGMASGALGFSSGVTLAPSIGIDSVLLVAGICVFIGVLFGYYPARRAARLDPVESLRYQ